MFLGDSRVEPDFEMMKRAVATDHKTALRIVSSSGSQGIKYGVSRVLNHFSAA